MGNLAAFGVGVVGALFIYLVKFRHRRLKEFLAAPRENYQVLLFDLVIFLALGGLAVVFLLEPDSAKEAFIGGAAWEGLVTSAIPTAPTEEGG